MALHKPEGLWKTQFKMRREAKGCSQTMKEQYSNEAGIELTQYSLKTPVSDAGQFRLRLPQFEDEFNLPSYPVGEKNLLETQLLLWDVGYEDLPILQRQEER